VKVSGKYGYIRRDGEFEIPPIFEQAFDFREGLAAVFLDERRSGFIDRNAKMVIAADLGYFSAFSEGLARFKKDELFGFMDSTGKVVIPPRFGFTHQFRDGICLVTTEDQIGYINRQGDWVWSGPFVEIPMDTRY
jgi:hypothetical protein